MIAVVTQYVMMRLREQSAELASFVIRSRSSCHIDLVSFVTNNDGTRPKNVTVNPSEWLAERFQAHRAHLRAVAYRMLGSLSEADDAVQEAWLRLTRFDPSGVANLGGWLTTVVARVCLDILRLRKSRREEPLGIHVPDPIVSREDQIDPEHEALLADSVGLALLVVLETLGPAERLAFVLHDMFGVPFDEIAPIVGRSPSAARQLASRARHRVQGAAKVPDADLTCQREVVDAFLAAARGGDLEALLAVLDPDVVVRADRGGVPPGASRELRGARAVAEQALTFSRLVQFARPVLVNGAAGRLVASGGTAVFGHGLYDQAQEDRRNRYPLRPCAPPSARLDGPRRLTPMMIGEHMHNKKLSFLAVLIFIRLCISACGYLGFPTCFRLHSSADPENRDTALEAMLPVDTELLSVAR